MAKLSVSGKFIKEVSQNIPGTKFAIIELIKNSYEAHSSMVRIYISPEKITIQDNGKGMNLEEIDTLLTVSDSNKIFGQKVEGVLISGEKGLGFFSVFKFGNKVKVDTVKDLEGYSFELNMEEISSQKSLYNLDIPLKKITGSNIHNGTTITITEIYKDTFDVFKKTLEKDDELMRLINVIDSPDINVEITKSWDTKNIQPKDITKLDKAKIALALFDSKLMKKKDGKYFFELVRKGNKRPFCIDSKFNELFDNEDIKLNMDISVYSLKGISKKHLPDIYYDSVNNRLVPLIYINKCLFDNYTLYNSEINSSKSNKQVFRQQIGKISLILTRPDIISFNSDRTKMTESVNSILFQEFLNYFSSKMQIRLRSMLDEEVPNKPQVSNRTCYINQTPDLKHGDYDIKSIKHNGEKTSNVTTDSPGLWEIVYNNNDKLILDVVERPDPIIKQKISEFLVGTEYRFDDLFIFEDCEGTRKIKPLEFTVTPEDCRSMNHKLRTITFNRPCSNIFFKISIEDKVSNKKINGEYKGVSLFPISKRTSKVDIEDIMVHSLMQIDQNVKEDIYIFKNQLNDIYRDRKKYEYILISSLRTFVELMVNDIVEKLGEKQEKYLEKNFKTISDSKNIKDRFINKIQNDREKAGVLEIYNQAFEQGRYNSTISYLNLTTHGAGRIISLKQIEVDFPIINLLYTYLCFLNMP